MKFLLAILLSTISLASFEQSASGNAKSNDSTFIFIYRVGQFGGSLTNWTIWVDEQKLCKLSNNRYIQVPVQPGKHNVSAKMSGVGVFKKETEVDIDAETGGSYYVACNIKQSIMRARLEMIEVTKSTGKKQMENMTMDNCETKMEAKQ
jgi:Protein of unknown function (DUF2846)